MEVVVGAVLVVVVGGGSDGPSLRAPSRPFTDVVCSPVGGESWAVAVLVVVSPAGIFVRLSLEPLVELGTDVVGGATDSSTPDVAVPAAPV